MTAKEAAGPAVGTGVLHLFWKKPTGANLEEADAAVERARHDGLQVIAFSVLGHKADAGTLVLGQDLQRARQLQGELTAAGLQLSWSYVSLTEVSEYAAGMPEEMKRARLYPELPPADARFVCFYPMNRRRTEGANWYSLPYEERERLMLEHGATGRKFRGRVLQLVTGSSGLDDWEWGVTLFAADPADLKEVVYVMRFDEASARYGEFGPFVVGLLHDSLSESMVGAS
jgi:hydrogen peroxide-dependent heme synthase